MINSFTKVFDNIESLGGHRDRVILGGQSAGGNIVSFPSDSLPHQNKPGVRATTEDLGSLPVGSCSYAASTRHKPRLILRATLKGSISRSPQG